MDAKRSITQVIQTAGGDSEELAAELMPLLYDELRRLAVQMMAKLPPKQTLQPTALVHEAYLRLVASDTRDWQSRQHFFRTAARAMRFILVDQARRKATAKHGGRISDSDPEQLSIEVNSSPEELLALHEALEELEAKEPRQAQLVELRFFGGLSEPEVAEVLGLSRTSVAREWRYARYWLYRRIEGTNGGTQS